MLGGRVVLLDLETTGAHPQRDRITEIGLIELAGGEPAGEWATLVNPGCSIAPFITRLTGIDDAMVSGAPRFAELADELRERLAGRLLVAHNARFDYGFLRHEFRRLGQPFEARVLCSARLSRKLYPGQHRHSLDALIARHGLVCPERHRALGDARALRDFLRVAAGELGADAVQRMADRLTEAPARGGGRLAGLVEDLPEAPGAYACFAADGTVLHVGRALNLRAQLAAGAAPPDAAGSGRNARLASATARIEYEPAGGEFGAALAERMMARALAAPACGGRYATPPRFWSFRLLPAGGDGPQLERVEGSACADGERSVLHGLFRSAAGAHRALGELARSHRLCRVLLGLEERAPCSGRATQTCGGACTPGPGAESRAVHRLRLAAALAPLRIADWPHPRRIGLRDTRAPEPVAVHVFDDWRYVGSARDDAALAELAAQRACDPFDPELYRLLRRAFARPGSGLETVRLATAERAV
jgi:DNA polymerase-3 subunit epsilon